MLATQGGRFGGWSLLVLDGKPMFAYAYTNQDGAKYPKQRGQDPHRRRREAHAGQAHHRFRFRLRRRRLGKGGRGTLTVDGKKVAESRIEQTSPLGKFSLDESFDVGRTPARR